LFDRCLVALGFKLKQFRSAGLSRVDVVAADDRVIDVLLDGLHSCFQHLSAQGAIVIWYFGCEKYREDMNFFEIGDLNMEVVGGDVQRSKLVGIGSPGSFRK
jgi:hypothetical protein